MPFFEPRFLHRFAKCDADIFNGVVLVDVQIAFCGDA
jgi:hypothetical protein